MLGIEAVASYLPGTRKSNLAMAETFGVTESFLEDKIGVIERPVKSSEEDTSDLALKSLEALLDKTKLDPQSIEALIVVTQNPDSTIPHVSGLLHGKAGLAAECATFDISLGCSGFVYGISVLQSLLSASDLSRGVLITCDPYSKILDEQDKNTALLFGDAATATLVGPSPKFTCRSFAYGSKGDLNGALTNRSGQLEMDGRGIFNFAASCVPGNVNQTLDKAGLTLEDIDFFLFHQGSRYILDTLTRKMKIAPEKVVVDIRETGNTVSSSIPLLLEKKLDDPAARRMILSGFGVGLSYASCLCERKDT